MGAEERQEAKQKAPKIIKELVKRFEQNSSSYKSQGYNEAQLRNEFINPFFEALGWDVYNKSGAAPAYRDVIHEDSIKVGVGTKAPDYCFTLSGRRMFFVETKKPSVNIKKDANPAFQLRRYGWSSKLSLSILTNFEEFAVYESRQRPHVTDKTSTERLMSISSKEYAERWDEIYNIFSYESVKQGSFDRFAESAKKKHGTQEVDDEFLKEIEEWREKFAKNIALRNPNLTVRELNYCVQRTIDRIIFLRMCEDKGIEKYGQLRSIAEKNNIYANLRNIFKKADEKYNSGLFHFKKERNRSTLPDELTLKLTIDDNVLKNIFRHLYYPNSPYEFSVLSPEILGNVYEQFLGKVIRLTEGHRAKIEEKPEVKKAGGVYYTPQYIVDYIVENTVGKLCNGKTPQQISKLKILDPACGSGSFLLVGYSHLLQYHLDYYTSRKSSKRYKDQIYQGKGGEWNLTIKEKKRILVNNVFGVDIDSQAVEVTKLSLLLKVLEGESRDVFEKQQKLWRERALPDLGSNIKCGNSLICPDFYNGGAQTSLFDENEMFRINVFDWNGEFSEIMSKGGFDVVIGNPPYVRQEMLGELKEYFQKHYQVYHGIADLYVYFIEKGMTLLRKEGIFSYIVANKWMRVNYGEPLRKWMKRQYINEIVDFGDLPVFQGATTYPCILRISKDSPKKTFDVTQVKTLDFANIKEYTKKNYYKVSQNHLNDSGWSLTDKRTRTLLNKIKTAGPPLGEYVNKGIYYGIKTGLNKAFIIDQQKRNEIISKNPKSENLIKPFLMGRDIKRYETPGGNRFLILIPKGWTRLNSGGVLNSWDWFKKNHPMIAKHLLPYEKEAEKRYDKGECWWELRACDYYDEFEKSKIMLPDISIRGNFTLDSKGEIYCVNTAYIISSSDKYLLGILNSSLTTFYYENLSSRYRGGYLRFIYQYLMQLPVHVIDFSKSSEKELHEKIVRSVEKMIELNNELKKATTETKKTMIQRHIEASDRQIDELVYELYDLSDKEIEIVEKTTS